MRIHGFLFLSESKRRKLIKVSMTISLIFAIIGTMFSPAPLEANGGLAPIAGPGAGIACYQLSAASGAVGIAAMATTVVPVIVATGAVVYYVTKNYPKREKTTFVPDKAKDVIEKIKNNNGKPPQGYSGGRKFKNHEKTLPEGPEYKEYDVNPFNKGYERDPERVVIGSDGSAWYTADHYVTFLPVN